MEAESAELCGLPGEDSELLRKGEFNRLVTQVKFYHYRPMHKQLGELQEMLVKHHELLQGHIEQDRMFFAKLSGAKWAIWGIAGAMAAIVPLLYQMIKALQIVGVL